MNRIHVIPAEEGGWDVTNGRCQLVRFRTQEQAVKEAKDLAQLNSAELLVHGKDGRIIEKNTYNPNSSQ